VNRASELFAPALAGALLLFAVVYGGDYAYLHYRMARPQSGDAFGSVRVQRLYAIPLKDGKTEYEFDEQQPAVTVRCVHSIFGHDGYASCWKTKRDSDKPIPM
jgi:hypothetical protein